MNVSALHILCNTNTNLFHRILPLSDLLYKQSYTVLKWQRLNCQLIDFICCTYMCLRFNIFSICFHRTLCSHHSQITSACFMLTKWQSSSSSIFYNRGCYFQAGRSLKLGTSIDVGFRMALETWASWVEKRVDLNRTHVFFRTYEPSHWGYVIYNKLRLWKIIMVVRHLNLIKKRY